MHIYLNGQVQPDSTCGISTTDRGFLLGDGLFETLKIINGIPLFLNEHINRLLHGANLLSIPITLTPQKVAEALSDLLVANNLQDASMVSARITLTRGGGPRGLLPPANVFPTILITVSPYAAGLDKPLALWVTSTRRNEYSPISNIKSLAYAENIFGRMEAAANGADDALFLNTQGLVAETSMCNVFIIKNDTLITPPLTDGVLPGIIRGKTIAIAKSLHIPVSESSFRLDECYKADGMFVTNSLMDIKIINSINKKPISEHPSIPQIMAKELVALYSPENKGKCSSPENNGTYLL